MPLGQHVSDGSASSGPGSEDRGRGEGRHAGTLAGREGRGGGRGRHPGRRRRRI